MKIPEKLKTRKKLLLGLSISFFIFATSGAIYLTSEQKISRKPYWNPQSKDRETNSEKLNDRRLLADYFLSNRFKGMVEYNLHLKSQGPANWDKLLRRNLQEMMFSSEQFPPKPSPKPHLLDRLLKKLRGLLTLKIQNKEWPASTYRADLIVEPEYHYSLDPDSLLTDSHYLSFEQINEYSDALKKKPQTFGESIHELYLPDNARTYQFKGGVITIALPGSKDFPIAPGGKKAHAKIRYRKYFRVARKDDLNIQFDQEVLAQNKVNIEYLHFQDESSNQFHLTVDYVKWVNLEGPTQSTAEYLIITPGKILSPISKSSFNREPAALIGPNVEDYTTGRLYLRGQYKEMPFETTFKKIIFDIKKGEFLPHDSLIETIFKGGRLSYEAASNEIINKEDFLMARGRAKSRLKLLFLKKHGAHFYEDLNLARFIEGEK